MRHYRSSRIGGGSGGNEFGWIEESGTLTRGFKIKVIDSLAPAIFLDGLVTFRARSSIGRQPLSRPCIVSRIRDPQTHGFTDHWTVIIIHATSETKDMVFVNRASNGRHVSWQWRCGDVFTTDGLLARWIWAKAKIGRAFDESFQKQLLVSSGHISSYRTIISNTTYLMKVSWSQRHSRSRSVRTTLQFSSIHKTVHWPSLLIFPCAYIP